MIGEFGILSLMRIFQRPILWITKLLGCNENNLLVPSQLCNSQAEKILSGASADVGEFIDQFIRDKYVLEIASGGGTALVEFLQKERGAKTAISTDIVQQKRKARPDLYFKANLNSLRNREDKIRKKFSDNLPDTIIGTSFFGVPGLSTEDTKQWLTECSKVVAPGGVIIVDFLMYEIPWFSKYWHFEGKHVNREMFEEILNELKMAKIIQCWHVGEINAFTIYKCPPFWPRPPSYTYQIFHTENECNPVR